MMCRGYIFCGKLLTVGSKYADVTTILYNILAENDKYTKYSREGRRMLEIKIGSNLSTSPPQLETFKISEEREWWAMTSRMQAGMETTLHHAWSYWWSRGECERGPLHKRGTHNLNILLYLSQSDFKHNVIMSARIQWVQFNSKTPGMDLNLHINTIITWVYNHLVMRGGGGIVASVRMSLECPIQHVSRTPAAVVGWPRQAGRPGDQTDRGGAPSPRKQVHNNYDG